MKRTLLSTFYCFWFVQEGGCGCCYGHRCAVEMRVSAGTGGGFDSELFPWISPSLTHTFLSAFLPHSLSFHDLYTAVFCRTAESKLHSAHSNLCSFMKTGFPWTWFWCEAINQWDLCLLVNENRHREEQKKQSHTHTHAHTHTLHSISLSTLPAKCQVSHK